MKCARKRDCSDIDRLFDALRTTSAKQAKARLQALAGISPPLVSAALVELIRDPPWRSPASLTMWTEVFRLLNETSDSSVTSELEVLATEYTRVMPTAVGLKMTKRLLRAIEKLRRTQTVSQPDPSTLDLLDKVEAVIGENRPPRKPVSEADLALEIYAAPSDDAPRAVLADLLEDRGRIRGQFINLQLARAAGASNAEANAAELAIVTGENTTAWSGGLAPALDALIYRRGFLSYVRLKRNMKAFSLLRSSSSWATVEALALPKPAPSHRTITVTDVAALLESQQGASINTLLQASEILVDELERRRLLGQISRLLAYSQSSAPVRLVNLLLRWIAVSKAGVHLGIGLSGSIPEFQFFHLTPLVRADNFSVVRTLTVEIDPHHQFGEMSGWRHVCLDSEIRSLRFNIVGPRPMFAELKRDERGPFRELIVRLESPGDDGALELRLQELVDLHRSLGHELALILDMRTVHCPGLPEQIETCLLSARSRRAIASKSGVRPTVLRGSADRPALRVY